MNILVIEDEDSVAELLHRALEDMGNECWRANTAAEASRLLAERPVEAVTLDLGIPDSCGLDWLESVARHRPGLARRTLVITGRQLEPALAERLTRCGAGLLSKPFTLAALYEAVRTQIEPRARGPRRPN